jgi:hypothetical protein
MEVYSHALAIATTKKETKSLPIVGLVARREYIDDHDLIRDRSD